MHMTESDSMAATVFVVDDDSTFLAAMKRLLSSAGHSVETFASAQKLLQRREHLGPGCLIVDLRMPGDSGLDLQAKLNQSEYSLPIIFMTGAGDTESGVNAMKGGAVDFLSKPVDDDVLFEAIADAIEKDRRDRALHDRQVRARKIIATLTKREKEVMRHVVTGTPNKIIAYKLGISEKTVKAHRGRVMHKAGAKSIVDLVNISALADNPDQ
jgi:FixJ family two-component response regulator